MTTDFTNNNTTIAPSGGFQPKTKNTPLDVRTRVNSKSDIDSIPNPFVGMKIIVLQDETNDNQMTEYVVTSLKANALGIADMKINEVVLTKDFLGVSGNGMTDEQVQQLNAAYTHSQTPHVQQSQVPTRTSQLQNDSDFSTNASVDEKIASAVTGGNPTTIFKDLKATFYGDSLTEVNGHYTKGYHRWISEILGLVSYENYGVSGYTIKDVANKVSSTNAAGDIIFVMAGVNDQTMHKQLGTFNDDSSADTTYGALKLLCSTLKTKYPTKLIVYITPHYQVRYPSNLGITSYEISKAIKEVCYLYAIPVYDNYQLCGIYPQNEANKTLFTTDGCHWNNLGHEMVGKNIAKYMLNTFGYVRRITENDEIPSTPSTPSTPTTSFVGKTCTFTSNKYVNCFHLTALIARPDFSIAEKQLNATLSISNTSNIIDTTLTQVGIFNDNTGEVSNGKFTAQLIQGAVNDIISGNTASYTIKGKFGADDTNNNPTYMKIPFIIGFSTIPASFTIDSIAITIDGQEQEVLKLGGFFESEIAEFN